ncbi:hypothetical protein HanPSC8_Chr17g0784091 [Helianthus annuus]|nr:hypothetical protein HanPSC8_Chr17g0784091 [Helianthus annuus]
MNVNNLHTINQIFISKLTRFVNSIKPRLASSIYPHNSATPFVSLRTLVGTTGASSEFIGTTIRSRRSPTVCFDDNTAR